MDAGSTVRWKYLIVGSLDLVFRKEVQTQEMPIWEKSTGPYQVKLREEKIYARGNYMVKIKFRRTLNSELWWRGAMKNRKKQMAKHHTTVFNWRSCCCLFSFLQEIYMAVAFKTCCKWNLVFRGKRRMSSQRKG